MSAHDTTLKSSDDFTPPKVKWVRKRGANNNCSIYYTKEVKKLNPFKTYFLDECYRLILGKIRSNPGKIVLVGFKLFYKQRVLRGSRWHREELFTHLDPDEVNEENLDRALSIYRDIMYDNFIHMKNDLDNHRFCEKGCEHNVLFCNFTNLSIYFIVGGKELRFTDNSIRDM